MHTGATKIDHIFWGVNFSLLEDIKDGNGQHI